MLVVPGVARFAVEQTIEDRNAVNVLDYRIDTTGSTMDRDTAIRNQARSIITEWINHVLPYLADDWSLTRVSYVDLNSETGVTGSELTDGTTNLPVPGASAGASLPGNTAYLVTKQTSSARGRRNGRIYVAGLTEDASDPSNGNLLTSTASGLLQAGWDSFLSATNEIDTFGTAFSSNMVVTHVTERDIDGNPTAGVGSTVDALVVDNRLATQRRRLRG